MHIPTVKVDTPLFPPKGCTQMTKRGAIINPIPCVIGEASSKYTSPNLRKVFFFWFVPPPPDLSRHAWIFFVVFFSLPIWKTDLPPLCLLISYCVAQLMILLMILDSIVCFYAPFPLLFCQKYLDPPSFYLIPLTISIFFWNPPFSFDFQPPVPHSLFNRVSSGFFAQCSPHPFFKLFCVPLAGFTLEWRRAECFRSLLESLCFLTVSSTDKGPLRKRIVPFIG